MAPALSRQTWAILDSVAKYFNEPESQYVLHQSSISLRPEFAHNWQECMQQNPRKKNTCQRSYVCAAMIFLMFFFVGLPVRSIKEAARRILIRHQLDILVVDQGVRHE
eukprot:3719883-Pyramimonas_sp.AAC.1